LSRLVICISIISEKPLQCLQPPQKQRQVDIGVLQEQGSGHAEPGRWRA
jgi:hypothetical protein